MHSWKKNNNIDLYFEDLDFIDHFTEEFQNIKNIIYENNTELYQIIKNNKEKLKQYAGNIKSSVVSVLLQDYERRILEIMVNYVDTNKVVLCYDGFMLPISKFNKNPTLIDDLQNIVKDKTGFTIKLVTKKFTPLTQEEIKNNIIENDFPEYKDVKESFEKIYARIPNNFVKFEDNKYSFVTKQYLIDNYENMMYYNSETGKNDYFLSRWIKDPY